MDQSLSILNPSTFAGFHHRFPLSVVHVGKSQTGCARCHRKVGFLCYDNMGVSIFVSIIPKQPSYNPYYDIVVSISFPLSLYNPQSLNPKPTITQDIQALQNQRVCGSN